MASTASRYVERYGLGWVSTWRFEPWNEPDHACNSDRKLDQGIDCDLDSWLEMYEASSRAISSVSNKLLFGGPNTGGSTLSSTPNFLDGLLKRVNETQGQLKLDFISWHAKGTVLPQKEASARMVLENDENICELLWARLYSLP